MLFNSALSYRSIFLHFFIIFLTKFQRSSANFWINCSINCLDLFNEMLMLNATQLIMITSSSPHHATGEGNNGTAQIHQQHSPQTGNLYLMVDPGIVPNAYAQHIQIFNLQEGIRHIVGYCLPLKQCTSIEAFKTVQRARMLKTIDKNPFHDQQFTCKFKFLHTPLSVIPANEEEYHAMIKGPPLPCRDSGNGKDNVRCNRFYARPSACSPSPAQKRFQIEENAMHFVMEKYRLHMNPHLIPYRLPDGLDCFIRLELALHCQHEILEYNYMLVRQPYHCIRENHRNDDDYYSTKRKNGCGRFFKYPSASK